MTQTSANIPFINQHTIEALFDFPRLIERLKQAFAQSDLATGIVVPMRHHHDYANPSQGMDSTLLLMPAWQPDQQLGVKIVTVSPNNARYQLPSIQGLYLLFDAQHGQCQSLLDAKALTAYRTAATSALAASYLARTNAQRLLMVGTGTLAIPLIKAHSAVRDLKQIFIWGRSRDKAQAIQQQLTAEGFDITVVDDLPSAIGQVDIISVATLSATPLIQGKWLQPGQHLDLVGAYKPDMREADDDCILRAEIFVDHYAGAIKETGDIVIPIQEGLITQQDIQAQLVDLCQNTHPGRRDDDTITLFKSVGHALEDLTAATLICEQLQSNR